LEKIVLGIETSCDDTSICLLKGHPGEYQKVPEVLAIKSFSQEVLLKKWGGVVPEIAARNHLDKITLLLKETFNEAGLETSQVDLLGVTTHPGLLGPLLTGLGAAKTLSLLGHQPILPVNHLYAHLEAIHLTSPVPYPYLGLLVSGGHSIFMLVHSSVHFEILGMTIDDAAGEAFDKGGKLLGLAYPAGREIDELSKLGDENKYQFPIGLKTSKDASLSFSGVKTSIRNLLEREPSLLQEDSALNDICASYQKSIVDALVLKGRFALEIAEKKIGGSIPVVIGGGVACNSKLRSEYQKHFSEVYMVAPKFCTDNGGMIANYALRRFEDGVPFPECLSLDAKSRFISKGDMLKKRREEKNRLTK